MSQSSSAHTDNHKRSRQQCTATTPHKEQVNEAMAVAASTPLARRLTGLQPTHTTDWLVQQEAQDSNHKRFQIQSQAAPTGQTPTSENQDSSLGAGEPYCVFPRLVLKSRISQSSYGPVQKSQLWSQQPDPGFVLYYLSVLLKTFFLEFLYFIYIYASFSNWISVFFLLKIYHFSLPLLFLPFCFLHHIRFTL